MEILQENSNPAFQFLSKITTGIHEYVISLSLFFDISAFTTYLVAWFICGLMGVLIYKFLAEGPANPFSREKYEREMFWFITLTGPFGCIASCVSWLDLFRSNMRAGEFGATEANTNGTKVMGNKDSSVLDIREVRKFM